MRLLCLLLPRLGIQLARRNRPERAGRTLVLLRGHGHDALVASATCDASTRGLLPGMTAAEARRRCPEALFLPDSPSDSLDMLEHLAGILRGRATPLVAIGGREHLFVDITRLATGLKEELRLAERLSSLAAAWSGCDVRAGVASSRDEALDAARAARRGPVVCPAAFAEEPPIAPWRPDESIEAAAAVDPEANELAIGARLDQLARRLDLVLAARGQSFRTLTLLVEHGNGATEHRARLQQPAHSVAEVLRQLPPAGAIPAGATHIRLALGRLGPDVRVPPCAASAAARPARVPRPIALPVLARAG